MSLIIKLYKCNTCNKIKSHNQFLQFKNGKYIKKCIMCKNKYNCEHGRMKHRCKDCNGEDYNSENLTEVAKIMYTVGIID